MESTTLIGVTEPAHMDGHVLDTWVESFPNLLSYGRQGLSARDNVHHVLFLPYVAVDCVNGGVVFDADTWRAHREVFETHVVEG